MRDRGPGRHRDQINQRLWAFYTWCADAEVPELTTLAETIETWWPAIELFLTTGLTNARTEGTNRLIKQVKCLRIPKPGQLPPPSTVALHPANTPIVSEEPDGARLRSKSPQRRHQRMSPALPHPSRRCTHIFSHPHLDV
ncbi:MAG: transposase [Pseudonocardiaceae bacterium]